MFASMIPLFPPSTLLLSAAQSTKAGFTSHASSSQPEWSYLTLPPSSPPSSSPSPPPLPLLFPSSSPPLPLPLLFPFLSLLDACVSGQDLIKIQSVVLCISFRKSGHLCKKANLQKDTSEHGRDVSVKSLHCDQFCHTMFTIGHNCAKFGHRVNVKGQDLYRPPLAAVLCFLKVFFLQIPGKMCNCDQSKPVIWTGDKIYHFTKDQKP